MPDGNLRDEFNSRLEAAEARTAASFARVEARIEGLIEIIKGPNGVLEQVAELRGEVRSLRADNRFTRYTILATGIASAIGVVALAFALVQIDAAHQANLMAAFQVNRR